MSPYFRLTVFIAVLCLTSGCPMRPNPLWSSDSGDDWIDVDIAVDVVEPDAEEPDVGEVDADEDVDMGTEEPLDADQPTDVAVDAVDADDDVEVDCGEEMQYCDGECVSVYSELHCGVCGRACALVEACSCSGFAPQCTIPGGDRCFTTCLEGELLCDGSCVVQPDDFHCGECGVRCDPHLSCQCRSTDEGTYVCLTMDGSEC